MKWVGLLIVLSVVWPLSQWLRRNPRKAPKIWALVGFLPFATTFLHLNVALISWPEWSGYVKGLEFSVLDGLALAFYLSLGRTHHPLPFKLSMALYFLAVWFSVPWAEVPTAAIFYVWQLARMFLLYAVVARACVDERIPFAILKGMAFGVLVEAVVAIWQRFGLGMLQVHGTVDHQNLLGMMTHPVVFPAFGLLMAGHAGRIIGAVPLAGIVVDVLTTSRGTVAVATFGFAILVVLSALRKWTTRKAFILFTGILAVLVAAPIAFSSFGDRFALEKAEFGNSDYDERAAFETAASMMLSDRPLGVGANHYVMVANVGGYNARAGVAQTMSSYSAVVHNIYWLVAAETGYPGIVTFVLLLFRPLVAAFLCSWRNPRDPRGDLLLGLGVALLTIYIQSFYEWVFITFDSQYLLAIEFGLVAGLAQQLGYWQGRSSPRLNLSPVRIESLRPKPPVSEDRYPTL